MLPQSTPIKQHRCRCGHLATAHTLPNVHGACQGIQDNTESLSEYPIQSRLGILPYREWPCECQRYEAE